MKNRKNEGIAHELEGDLDIRSMFEGSHNKYLLVNLLARRARELNEGARPLVADYARYRTPLEVALAEAKIGALKTEKRQPPAAAEPAEEEAD